MHIILDLFYYFALTHPLLSSIEKKYIGTWSVPLMPLNRYATVYGLPFTS